jgi:hypothetical protein
MSEGVNLQGASAVVLLDMPGVIRLAEQRIGRIDRMNSEHDAIEVYWPNDSEPFQLTTSRKFVTRYNATRRVIGVNMPLPDELKHEREERFTVHKVIDLYDDAQREMEDRGFLQDAFLPVRSIRDDLVPPDVYSRIKDSRVPVLSRASFVTADEPWGFFTIRGSTSRSPQWVLVRTGHVERDLAAIASFLRANLAECEQIHWHAGGLNSMLHTLQESEHKLLPRRRYRALTLLARSLDAWRELLHAENGSADVLRGWLSPFRKGATVRRRPDEPSPDYYDLGGRFLDLLGPYYERAMDRRRRGVVRLKNLGTYLEADPLPAAVLDRLVQETHQLPPLNLRIAACIIGTGGSEEPSE